MATISFSLGSPETNSITYCIIVANAVGNINFSIEANGTQYQNGSGSGYVYGTITGLSSGTYYNFTAHVWDSEGYVGSASASERTIEEYKPRPSYFYWDNSKRSGERFDLTANEWNRLTYNVNEIRSYKGYGQYYFNYVYRGDPVTANIFNQVVYAINSMEYCGVSSKSRGNVVYPNDLDALVNTLNSIY